MAGGATGQHNMLRELPNSPEPQTLRLARLEIFPPASPCCPRPGLEGKLFSVSTPDPRVSRMGQLADNTSV